jgi:hypothetical protein
MREKDYRKLYECEFSIMERVITEKEIFQKRLDGKPIMVRTQRSTREQYIEMFETFWRTGVIRPLGMHEQSDGFNAIVTHTWVNHYGTNGTLNDWEKHSKGKMLRIPDKEWQRRYADWCLKINK